MNPSDFRLKQSKQQKAGKAKVKRDAARAKVTALPREDSDDLIQAEFKKLLKLPLWKRKLAGHDGYATTRPYLKIQRSRTSARFQGLGGVSGRAWNGGRTHIRIGPNADWAQICKVMVHELAHHACPYSEKHGEKFCSVFTEGMHQAYGVQLEELPDDRGGWNNYSYALGAAFAAELRKMLPASERAAYNEQRARKRGKRAPPKPPACGPGIVAVRLTPTAANILHDHASEGLMNGEACGRVMDDNPKGQWYRGRPADWAQAAYSLETSVGLSWTQNEYGDSIASKEEALYAVVERIKEAIK